MSDTRPGQSFGLFPRLAIAFVAVALAAIVVVALLTFAAARAQVASFAESSRTSTAEFIGAALESAYAEAGDWREADLTPAVTLAAAAPATLQIVATDGTVVADPGLAMNNMMASMHGGDARPLGDPRPVSLSVDGAPIGTATLRFPADELPGGEAQLLAALGRTALLSAVVAALVALVAALLVAQRITRPLRTLATAARRFGAGDPAARVDAVAAGEIGEVGAAFNRMADVLARRARQQRELAGTVAHELRTPTAILQASLEALLDGVEQPSTEQLASLHDEVLRLQRNIADLESLSAAEAAELTLMLATTNLASVATGAASALAPQFASGDVTLRTVLQDVDVQADADRLRQVVTNLLANALKFTPAGGDVTLSTRARDGDAELSVADTGVGIPADDQERVFERFWRGRNAEGVGGRGVGLAIVVELVRAHGGAVTVISQVGRGSTFFVRLPRSR
jgi:signal transduction histidine kinase